MRQLKLIELLSTGARQEFPLDGLQQVNARAGAVYSVVDTESLEVPEDLVLRRKDDGLEVEVDGEVVANIDGFYADDASSLFMVEEAEGTASVGTMIGPEDLPPDWDTRVAEDADSNIVWEPEDRSTNWALYAGGGALAAGALAAAAGGGGGGDGGDTTPPTIVSPDGSDVVSIAIDENIEPGVIYTAEANEAATFSLKAGLDDDVSSFSIDSDGAVILRESPDFESQPSYSFTVVATDTAGNSSEQRVNVSVNDLAPAITSGAGPARISEDGGPGQTVYTATANEPATFSLIGEDAASFTINETSGEVILTESPDFDVRPNYSFTVVATDAAGNNSEQTVTLEVIDPNSTDDIAPTITSGATATTINENTGADQEIYTVTSNDNLATYSLKEEADAASFSINSSTGVVTLLEAPDFESQPGYSFTVVATDPAGNNGEQAVTLAIRDLAPMITSGATAPAIDENTGPGQIVYKATANETATFSLKPGLNAVSFAIDSSSGEVTLTDSPDFESQSSYDFIVVATDAGGNSSEQLVELAVNNLPDTDIDAPRITSGATATPIDENSGSGQTVYTATANEPATFSLKAGLDAASFAINGNNGRVVLSDSPDFEVQSSYRFTVVATDSAGNRGEQTVTLAINDLDEIAPMFESAPTATVDENTEAGQTVYTAAVNEPATFSLKTGSDPAVEVTDTGLVSLTESPDFERQSEYQFIVVATDTAGNSNELPITLSVNDLDEDPPQITSGSAVSSIDENTAASQVIYTATADESVTFSLAGTDANSFTVNRLSATSAEVILTDAPDFEQQSSYNFTVIATDEAGNTANQPLTLTINDLDDTEPVITLEPESATIDENVEAGQTVYTATANEPVTFSLKAGSDPAIAITDNGIVTLTESPDFERQSEYQFTVIATDTVGLSDELAVTLGVNNLPEISSGPTATTVNEDIPPGQLVYTATADKEVTFSLRTGLDDDASSFSIDATSGAVTLTESPDFDDQPYTFTVVATDAAGNFDEQIVNMRVTEGIDVGEVEPNAVIFDTTTVSADHSAQTFSPTLDDNTIIADDSGLESSGLASEQVWSEAGNLTMTDQTLFLGSGGSQASEPELPDSAIQALKTLSVSALDTVSSYGTSVQVNANLWTSQLDFYDGVSVLTSGQSYLVTIPDSVTLPV